jgi:glycosyltransferase involved in cell wall biosynthesis
MKIVFLGDARSIHFARWVQYFVERGHQVHVWSAEPPAEEMPNFLRLEPRFHWQPLLYSSLAVLVKKKLTEIGPDLVNAHFVPNYGFLAALSGRRPLAISAWGSDVLISPRKTLLHKWRVQWALSKAKLVTADARVSAVELLYLGVDKDNILVRPFGVPRMFFERGEAKILEKKKEMTILSCRQLEKLYNVETLLVALKRLKEKPNWRAVILGTGSQRHRLEKLSGKLGLAGRVQFLGKVPAADYQRLLLTSDIYVSTALSDSTSVSLLEALASRLACVVTEIPGNAEWITVMENGLTFVPKHDEMLAFLLGKLLEDDELRLRLAERAPERVREKAIWEENMADVEAAFSKLAGKQ